MLQATSSIIVIDTVNFMPQKGWQFQNVMTWDKSMTKPLPSFFTLNFILYCLSSYILLDVAQLYNVKCFILKVPSAECQKAKTIYYV